MCSKLPYDHENCRHESTCKGLSISMLDFFFFPSPSSCPNNTTHLPFKITKSLISAVEATPSHLLPSIISSGDVLPSCFPPATTAPAPDSQPPAPAPAAAAPALAASTPLLATASSAAELVSVMPSCHPSPTAVAHTPPHPSAPSPELHTHVIRFAELTLQKMLGKGYFAEVWKAEWQHSPVAVKIIYREAFHNKNQRELFMQEARILRCSLEDFGPRSNKAT